MIKIFYGEDRDAAKKAILDFLGSDHEVIEGEMLEVGDLTNIFLGQSLFAPEKRRILLKNLSESAVFDKLADYLTTQNDVAVWEMKIDKRSTAYKALKESGVEMREFPVLQKPDIRVTFGVLDTALRDGVAAVKAVEKIENTEDPYMFFGLMVTQMLKRFEVSRGGAKERRILKEMAKVDLEMKSSSVEPWVLIKALLLRMKEI